MLAIISDLHLTDGTSGETIREGAFRAFHERLRDMAYDASWRADGRYKPVDKLDVILLGDILDVIRSTKWLGEAVRPWDDPQSPQFVSMVGSITDAILKNNAGSLGLLNGLNKITLPPATSEGKPALEGTLSRQPVPVQIHYVVGNHDWFYHLPGPAYDKIRKTIVAALGLANSPDNRFPHDPSESEVLQAACKTHQVFARHGDIFDPFNYEQDRDASSLGDAIVLQLLNRFPNEVQKLMGGELPADCTNGLREIDNVRPLLSVPIWINGLLRRTCPDASQAKRVKKIWDGLADEFLDLKFVRERDSLFNLFDSVDKLEWALKFSRGVSLRNLSNLMGWIADRVVTREKPFYPNAFTESAFKNRGARFIVYGHTHQHEIFPLDSSVVGGRVFNQIYINSGTWRQVHELARLHPDEQEFFGYHVMTYLAFYKDDERLGRPFEAWSGALGTA